MSAHTIKYKQYNNLILLHIENAIKFSILFKNLLLNIYFTISSIIRRLIDIMYTYFVTNMTSLQHK